MDVDTARMLYNRLYKGVDGFSASMGNRRRLQLHSKELTYGETTFNAMSTILEYVNPKPDDVFYDLGCGAGKAVIAAALLRDWKKLLGIEILEDVYTVAQGVLKQLEEYNQNLETPLPPVQFVNADLTTYDFSNGNVVYIASTCFDYDFMNNLAKRCERLASGSRIITLTKELNSPELHHANKMTMIMSWGDTTVHTYERI